MPKKQETTKSQSKASEAKGKAPAPSTPSRGDNGHSIKDKLGLSLINQGIVTAEQIEYALKIKEKENAGSVGVRAKRGLAQILVEDLEFEHDTIFQNVAVVYGFKRYDLKEDDLNDYRVEFIKKMFEPIPNSIRDYMVNKRIMPFRYDQDRPYRLIVIAADPTDRTIPAIVRSMNFQSHEVWYVPHSQMGVMLAKVFPPENEYLREMAQGELEIDDVDLEEESFDEAMIEAEINKSLLVNLVEGMLIEAVRLGCSDIHIIPGSSSTTEIMFRIDGMLQHWHTQEGVRPEALSAVAKDRSKNIDRFERERAQDGFIQRNVDGHNIRYRVSVIPIVGRDFQYKFESIVIRILDDRKVITDLDKLGFRGTAREMFLRAINQPQGMIIVTGPTGSGKSTTLIAALSHIVRPEINVLTVEDPVEYIINGVRQLKISHKMTFELALRSILRHDPDVVMVGEIRDKETGETGIKLANTGHLTFSTLHTNDAPSAVSRLFKMGIETFLIAYAINLIIAQRLMRTLCSECKVEVKDLDPAIPKSMGFSDKEIKESTFYEPNTEGCDVCNGGYKGRVAIHETLYFTKELRRLIFEAKGDINEEALRNQAIKDGMKTLVMVARDRVMDGICPISEITRVASDE